MNSDQTQRDLVFVSHAEKDRKWLDRLRVSLRFFEAQGLRTWDRTRIPPGHAWRDETDQALQSTRVAILLLSPDFLATDFIMREELPRLLAAAPQGLVQILPVLVRPCLYKFTEGLKSRKLFNQEPLAALSSTDADQVLSDVAEAAHSIATGTAVQAPQAAPAAQAHPPAAATTQARQAVIMTALPLEYQAVRELLCDLRDEVHPNGTVYESGRFSDSNGTWRVGIAEIGAGNDGAALEAERAIQHFSPSVILFVGVAGGIKDVRLGDVVVATKVYGYEAGKANGPRFLPRPSVGETAYAIEQRARAEARRSDWHSWLRERPTSPPRVFLGPIAAGEKVVASAESEVASFLREQYSDALAVEMEGRGFLKATRANPAVGAMVIRGISDLLDGKKEADAAGSQERAARHASAFAFAVLAKL